MDNYELDELHDKITYHISEIENNLEILTELLEDINIDETEPIYNFREILNNIFSTVEEKYEEKKIDIIKGEE